MFTTKEFKTDTDFPISNVQSWFMKTNNGFGTPMDMPHSDFDGTNVVATKKFQSHQPMELTNVNFTNNTIKNVQMCDVSAEPTPSVQQLENNQSEAKGDPSNSRINDLSIKTDKAHDQIKHLSGGSKLPTNKTNDRRRPPAKRPNQKKSQLPMSDMRNDPAVEGGDQFFLWYQRMSQYYSQCYPGYGTTPTMNSPKDSQNRPANANRQGYQSVGKSQAPKRDHQKQSLGRVPPYFPPSTSHQVLPQAAANPMDIASYYYQYYYGAAAAASANMWPGYYPFPGFLNTGRQTPMIYPNPHIRAWFSNPGYLLQILPNRPIDGELARVELLHMSRVANDAVAEATQRTETNMRTHGYSNFVDVRRDQVADTNRDGFSSNTSGLDSPDALSSIQCPTGEEESDDADTRACALVALAWDRIDHVDYPGPLDPSETLKCDVLTFLRKKMAELQDRLPTDWESATLLISYLQLLVNNNGVVPQRDLVTLLLEGHEPLTRQLHGPTSIAVNSKSTGSNIQYVPNLAQQSRAHMTDSMSSLNSLQLPSGRQSPHMPYGMYGMITPTANKVAHELNQVSHRAASEAGSYSNSQSILRRAAATVVAPRASTGADAEDAQLDRFRTLLMYGQSKQALLYACNCHLWGHAFTLAHRMGQQVLEKVIDSFLTCAVAPSDPILTLYQLKAGDIPQIVCEAAYGKGSENGEWRPHLAMILSSESTHPLDMKSLQRLGDSLLSRRLTYAAHLCYLLMSAQYDQTHGEQGHLVYRLHEKIWLLGAATPSPQNPSDPSEILAAPIEAVQLTEIYEYAMRLANRNYRLPQLLPFQLMYATRLLDAGLLVKAYHYLAAIGNAILVEASSNMQAVNPTTYSLIANCLRLAEPLLAHPDLDDLEFLAPDSSRFRIGRGMSSKSNRLFAGMPTNSSDNWIIKLRELYDRMHNKFHRHEPVVAARASPRSFEPTVQPNTSHLMHNQRQLDFEDHNHGVSGPRQDNSRPISHQQQHHQQQQSDYVPHQPQELYQIDIKQPPHPVRHPSQYSNMRGERTTVPNGDDGIIRSDAHVRATLPSPVGESTGMPNHPRIKTEQLDNYYMVDNQMTPTNSRGNNPVSSLGMDFRRLSLSQHSPSDCHQSVPTPTSTPRHDRHSQELQQMHQLHLQHPGPSTQWSAAPPSPTAVSSSASFPAPTEHSFGSRAGRANASSDQQQQSQQHAGHPGNRAPTSDTFFVPMNIQQSAVHGQSAFDYFAGVTQQAGGRSRTTSASSNTGTVVNHDQTRSRSNSGASQVRRDSATYERQTSSSIQHQNASQQKPHANRQYTGSHPIRDIKEESPVKVNPKPEDGPTAGADSTNQNQSKEEKSWGIFSMFRGRGSKNIHLPNDSKPSVSSSFCALVLNLVVLSI